MKASLPATPAATVAAAGVADDARRPSHAVVASGQHGFDRQLDAARQQGARTAAPPSAPSAAATAKNAPAPAAGGDDATGDAHDAKADDDKAAAHDGEPALVTAVFALFGQAQPAPAAAASAVAGATNGGPSPAAARPMAFMLPVAGDVAAATSAAVAAAAADAAGQAGEAPAANARGMAAALAATTVQAAAGAALRAAATLRLDERHEAGGEPAGALVPGASAPASTVAVAPTHALGVAAPAGSATFAQELGQQVVWLSGQDVKQANIRLHPKELGSLEVKVSLGHDGRVDVSFAAQHPAAVTAVQQTLGQLDLMLAGQGLSLGQAQVGQQGGGQRGDSSRPRGGDEAEPALDALTPVAARAAAIGLLDTFA
jgi:flagellar hook-length control protein FliK